MSPVIMVVMAFVFTAILFTMQAIYWAWIARKDREQDEMLRRLTGGGTTEEHEANLLVEQENDRAAAALGNFGLKVQQLLTSADSPNSVRDIITQMGVLGAVGSIGGILFVGIPGIFLGIPLMYIPYALLNMQAQNRSKALVQQIPDAMDLMARSLQAGVGLNDAFRMVAEEMEAPIAVEFGRVFEEVRFGREYRQAFTKMLERNPSIFDLRLMVSSILLQRETGGNLIEILENIGGTVRARFGFEAKVRAMTSEAKFSAMVLGGLPFAVMMMLTLSSPEYLMPLLEDPVGNVIVVVDMMLYGGGVMIMRDMTQVEV